MSASRRNCRGRVLGGAVLTLLGACHTDHSVVAGSLVITPGYATAAPLGDGGTAYFTVRNRSGDPDTLRDAEIEGATEATLHTVGRSGGLMRMLPLPRPPIGAHAALALHPGGPHLMFTGLRRPIHIGDSVTVILDFARAGQVRLHLAVRPYGG